jgi:glycine/D-amino acid oxidase-like deaminating enzyme
MPAIDLLPPDRTVPARANAVVIGGGIIGVSTALELKERGLDVVLVEKGEIAAEQSSRNWGWCRQMGRDPREIPLIKVALEKWRGMNNRVGEETGYRDCGILYFAETAEEFAKKESWYRENAVPAGLSTRLLSGPEATQLLPGMARKIHGAMYTPDDGRAEPFIAVPAMARHLRKLGGKVLTGVAARGLETAAGRVSAVVTEAGTIACDTVVLAGGVWTRRFLHNLGIAFPQNSVVNSVLRTSPVDLGHLRTFSGGRFAARKRLDGGYTVAHNHFSIADLTPDSFRLFFDFLPIYLMDWRGLRLRLGRRFLEEARLARRWELDEVSPFELVRILDPEPVQDILEDALAGLRDYVPAFAGVGVVERWAGVIDAMPDAVPVIDSLVQIPGLHIASGFSGHGFGLGPGAGQLMAELITGDKPCVDPEPFRYKRFFDGSRPRPLSGL